MFTLIGLVAVFFILLHKRSTGIVTVKMSWRERAFGPAPDFRETEETDSVPDFARLLNTLQQAAQAPSRSDGGSDRGRSAILALVRDDKFIEAIQLYRRLYGANLETAKQAVDKMMLEQ